MMTTKQQDQSFIAGTYGRFDAALQQGSGAVYTDEAGQEYIDFGTGIGVTCFGACDPLWVAAVEEQLHLMGHVSNLYYSAPMAKLAQAMCERTGMKKVFFGNSGAEANECAIKVARKYGEAKGKNVVLTLKNSFHGRTIATLAATGQDKFHEHFGPFPAGFRYVEANSCDALKEAFAAGDVCGLLMEVIQGEGGVNVMDADFVKYAEQLCHENDALFMIDEVQTGNGRTGKLYGYMHYGVTPDVVSTAKGLAGGLPMGACMLGEKAENVLAKGDHGSTFGGNPLCAAGALHVMTRMTDALMNEVAEKGAYIRRQLEAMPGVKGTSGLGLMIGISTEKASSQVAADCLKAGLMVLTAHEKVRLLPPLNISYADIDKGLAILKANL